MQIQAPTNVIGPGTPVDAIEFAMGRLSIRKRDFIRALKAGNRACEVLGGRKSLRVQMIQKLHVDLGIPYNTHMGASPYRCNNTTLLRPV